MWPPSDVIDRQLQRTTSGSCSTLSFLCLSLQEFEILSQIRQLQACCSRYSLPVNHHVAAWLQMHTLLTDQERCGVNTHTTAHRAKITRGASGHASFLTLPYFSPPPRSYELSRELEPPVDPCPCSPNSWSSRLLTKKKLS